MRINRIVADCFPLYSLVLIEMIPTPILSSRRSAWKKATSVKEQLKKEEKFSFRGQGQLTLAVVVYCEREIREREGG